MYHDRLGNKQQIYRSKDLITFHWRIYVDGMEANLECFSGTGLAYSRELRTSQIKNTSRDKQKAATLPTVRPLTYHSSLPAVRDLFLWILILE